MADVTKQDLLDLEERLTTSAQNMEDRILVFMRESQVHTENRLMEAMRNMQTEMLRGFEAFSTSHTTILPN